MHEKKQKRYLGMGYFEEENQFMESQLDITEVWWNPKINTSQNTSFYFVEIATFFNMIINLTHLSRDK